jgi:glutamine phosphoribosylpyrophosphate amidotransferase
MSTIFDSELDADRLREECGVFGVYGHPDAAALTALGLHALQHRGQEAAGIVSFDGERFQTERRLGLVGDHFSSAKVIDRLQGSATYAIRRRAKPFSATCSRCSPSLRQAASPWRITATSPTA